MLFWHEEKSCQAITCFVKHARACLSVFHPNTTENFWGQWWGRWAGKLAWQNLVINCEWNFCTWVSSLHLLTGDLDTTSEPNFVECYLASMLMATEMGCWAKIQVQAVKSLIKHIERPEFLGGTNWTNRHHGTRTDRTKLKLSLSFRWNASPSDFQCQGSQRGRKDLGTGDAARAVGWIMRWVWWHIW